MKESKIDRIIHTVQKRKDLARELLAGPLEYGTLASVTDQSRSTIDRTVAEFTALEMISETNGRLELTLFGKLLANRLVRFDRTIRAVVTHTAPETRGFRSPTGEPSRLITDNDRRLHWLQSPHQKRDLTEVLNLSRSTIDRWLREMEAVNLLERTPEGYRMTSVCYYMYTTYLHLRTSLQSIVSIQDVLDRLPQGGPLDPRIFERIGVDRTNPAVPFRLPASVSERLRRADRVRAILPIISSPQIIDRLHNRVLRHGATVELVVTEAGVAGLLRAFPHRLLEIDSSGRGKFYASDEPLSEMGVLLVDGPDPTTATILSFGEHWAIYGAIHSRSPVAIEWTESYFRHVRDAATRRVSPR